MNVIWWISSSRAWHFVHLIFRITVWLVLLPSYCGQVQSMSSILHSLSYWKMLLDSVTFILLNLFPGNSQNWTGVYVDIYNALSTTICRLPFSFFFFFCPFLVCLAGSKAVSISEKLQERWKSVSQSMKKAIMMKHNFANNLSIMTSTRTPTT